MIFINNKIYFLFKSYTFFTDKIQASIERTNGTFKRSRNVYGASVKVSNLKNLYMTF